MRKQVAIGFLGTVLDKGGFGESRWKKWRPSVGICRQPQWPLHRLHLLQRLGAHLVERRAERRARRHGVEGVLRLGQQAPGVVDPLRQAHLIVLHRSTNAIGALNTCAWWFANSARPESEFGAVSAD